MAQIGRRLAEHILRRYVKDPQRVEVAGWIDADTVEAACLAHDLGHPPFGHIGESELKSQVEQRKADAYEGNAQSFRIVTKLAVRSVEKNEQGLNLTRATLRAILKYPWTKSAPAHMPKSANKWGCYFSEQRLLEDAFRIGPAGTLSTEASIMDIADDITYAVHDVEDFVRAGLIPLDRVANSLAEREKFLAYAGLRVVSKPKSKLPTTLRGLADAYFLKAPYSGSIADRAAIHDFASALIGRFMGGIDLSSAGVLTVEPQIRLEIDLLKQLTWFYVIDDPSLATLQLGQRQVLGALFGALQGWTERAWVDDKELVRLPTQLRNNLLAIRDDDLAQQAAGRDSGKLCARAVADYIASLTEAQAVNLHQRLVGGISTGSALDSWLRR